jgi:hypothetical protein
MIKLASQHPANLVHGSLLLARDMAAKLRLTTLFIFMRDALGFSGQCRETFAEIATDAATLEDDLLAAAKDGVLTVDELGRLTLRVREIQDEAQSGRITA